MKKHIHFIYTCMFILCVLPFVVQAENNQPHEVIESAKEQILSVLNQEREEIRTNPNKINDLVDKIILPVCDVERMGKYILAKHWKSASQEQKHTFVQEFQKMLIRTYGNHVVDYLDAEIIILPQKNTQDKLYQIVNTILDTNNGIKPLQVDYVFRVDESSSKIVDVRIEGMSILKTYRTAFTKEIAETSLDQLIARIVMSNQPSLAWNSNQ